MAQRLGLAAPLIAAALANSRGFYSAAGTVDTERVAVLEAALAAVGDGDSADRARILGVLAAELVFTGDAERWQGICDEALDMARRLGDPATVMDILAASWTVIWDPKHLDTRLQRSAEHMELAAQSGDPRQIVVAGLQRFGAALDAGDVDDADRALAIAAAASDGVSDPTLRWQTAVHRTKRLLLAGRTAEAEVAAQAAYDLGRSTGQPDAGAWDAVHLYGIRLDQGRLGELRESVVQIGSAYPMVWYWQIGLAMIDCELEHPERDTTSILARLASDDFRDVRFDLFWLFEMAQLAEISWHRRDAASARAIYERIQPYAAQLVSVRPLCIGAVERYLGLAAVTFDDLPAAGAHFAAACALHERIGAPTWLARTQLDWARMLLRRGGAGDVERAREMLSTVRDAARKLGLAAVDQHAAALLAAG